HLPLTRVAATHSSLPLRSLFFFFNDPATTEIYTLSLHDALPILARGDRVGICMEKRVEQAVAILGCLMADAIVVPVLPKLKAAKDRKSTRLNSSHRTISYAVFCLKKKKKNRNQNTKNGIIHNRNE